MSELKPYPKYKDSGVEWIGEIPEGWDVEKAKWNFNRVNETGYENYQLLSVSQRKGVVPREELEQRSVMAFKNLEQFKKVEQGQFVIHLRSFQSGFEMSQNTGIVSPAYTVFEVRNGAKNYFKYLFWTHNFIETISVTTMSLRDGKPINYIDFENILLPFPSVKEQMKIGEWLDKEVSNLNNLILKKYRIIELLKEKRQAIITETVTKGLNPNVEMKDSGIDWIGEIPEHWEEIKLKYVGNITMGQSPKAHDVNDEKKGRDLLQGNADITESVHGLNN